MDDDPRECNFEQSSSSNEEIIDDSSNEEFELQEVLPRDREKLIENKFIKEIIESSGLYIKQNDLVENAYNSRKELGLFHLFLNMTFFECLRSWTNQSSSKTISKEDFLAYVGLELAASLSKNNCLKDY